MNIDNSPWHYWVDLDRDGFLIRDGQDYEVSPNRFKTRTLAHQEIERMIREDMEAKAQEEQ